MKLQAAVQWSIQETTTDISPGEAGMLEGIGSSGLGTQREKTRPPHTYHRTT